MENQSARIISAGWLIDGTGDPIRRNLFLEITQGILASIREKREGEAVPGTVVDLSDHTLLPGLVDSHVHLCMSGTEDPLVRLRQQDFSFGEAEGVIEGHLGDHLRHGVLAVRDGGDYGGYTLRYRQERLPCRGLPMALKSAGRAWHAPGRYGRFIGRPPLEGKGLPRSIREGHGETDHVKIVNSGLNSLTVFARETPPQFGAEDLRGAVAQASVLGLRVMVHANGREPVRLAVDAGCHSIEHGFFMGEENLMRMRDRGTAWVPTACTMAAYARSLPRGGRESDTAKQNLEHQIGQIARARDLGVPVAAGTDAGSLGVHHGSSLMEEIRLLVVAGFSLEEAVQCATSQGADLLGLGEEMGRLVPGMPATFIALKGGPESLCGESTGLPRVFLHGRELPSGSLPERKIVDASPELA
ncbi:MAG: amidohydrolase family protein [Deltaproteobacteria bacterium]|nr:amidohydrolase family protein [Deltaproteobacteria bacterium]